MTIHRGGRNSTSTRTVLLLLAVAVAASCLFVLCYRYDNRYTAPGIQPSGGVLTLSEEDLLKNPVIFLVMDWEIYRGKLLSPNEFGENPPSPDELTFIGQYYGFEGKDKTASPHGSATYRLRMILPEQKRSYTLELPEIYSAYKLYVDGVLMKQMGEPDPSNFCAQTGNSTITVQAADSMEILIAVSDYSYFYSGMVRPPAFGDPTVVSSYMNLHYGLRVAAMAVALCVGLLSLCIRAMTKPRKGSAPENHLTLLYSLLCFCFVGYTCYPVVKTLVAGGLQWYHIENFCYCAIFLLVMLIQHHTSGFGGKTTAAFVLFGVFVCCCSLLVPYFLTDNLSLMLAYSRLLNLYTYASAVFLTISTAYSLYKSTIYSHILLAGMVVFDCALLIDRILPEHDPILLGWFREIAGGVLVALIGLLIADDIARQYRIRLILEEQVDNVTRMMELQSAYYPVLLEKEQDAKAARHDLRHHLLMLRELAIVGNMDALVGYLDEYDATHLQAGGVSYCKHTVVDMLLRLYAGKAEQRQICLTANIQIPEILDVSNVDLCVIISNLLENALEASAKLPTELRSIHIGIAYKIFRLSIIIDNSFDGVIHTVDGQFLSHKRKNSIGIGLASVKAVAGRYCGSASFYPDKEKRVFHSEVLLVVRQPNLPNTLE